VGEYCDAIYILNRENFGGSDLPFRPWTGVSNGYGNGGVFGLYNPDFGDRKLRTGSCAQMADFANAAASDVVLGALPSWCMNDDFPKCANYLANDDLWGDIL
jgi:hypothetical protein